MSDRGYSRSDRRSSRERHRHSEHSPRRKHERRSRSRSREHVGGPSHRRRDRSASPKRRRDRSRSHSRHKSRSRSRSRDRERRHHKRRRSRSRSSSEDSERRRKKERKKQKKKEKKAKSTALTAEWGKYGIISEVDVHDKGPEFRTWLIEERVINPDTASKDQIKKLFKEFTEDYNTATLPHEKYYNMDAYEKQMATIRSGESNLLEGLDTYDPNADVLSHTKGLKRVPVEKGSYLSRDQLEELRKVQRERDQMGKMKLLGMNIDSKIGIRMENTYDQ